MSGRQIVVYDRVIFRRQLYGGISEFWRRLTSEMACRDVVQFKWEREVAFPMFRPNVTPHIIFHSSYYRYSVGDKSKTVTTVHDLIHERGIAPGTLGLKARIFSKLKYQALKKSTVIVCVSNATAQDLMEFYPSIASRIPILVIHHGPTLERVADNDSIQLSKSDVIEDLFKSPYFLFVGQRGGYKNFALLLRAFYNSLTCRNGLRLLVVGKKFTTNEISLIKKLGLRRSVISVGHVSSSILSLLYQKAVALVYPSACEGFGLPVLDAMYLGCPVVAASVPPVLEVAEAAAELFESNCIDSLSRALDSILSSDRRSLLRESGLQRCQQFTWDAAVQKYLTAYKMAAEL